MANVRITVYSNLSTMLDAGLPVRKKRVIYIAQAREINIAAEFDRDAYRPRVVLPAVHDYWQGGNRHLDALLREGAGSGDPCR